MSRLTGPSWSGTWLPFAAAAISFLMLFVVYPELVLTFTVDPLEDALAVEGASREAVDASFPWWMALVSIGGVVLAGGVALVGLRLMEGSSEPVVPRSEGDVAEPPLRGTPGGPRYPQIPRR